MALPGGVLRDSSTCADRVQCLGIVKDAAKDCDVARVAKAFKRYFVGCGNGAGEVGMNDDSVKVTNH